MENTAKSPNLEIDSILNVIEEDIDKLLEVAIQYDITFNPLDPAWPELRRKTIL